MKKTTIQSILLSVIILLVAGGLVWLIAGKNDSAQGNSADNALTLYYSPECPHCQNVEAYIRENNIEEKFGVVQKEVGTNAKNSNELMVRAQLCDLDISSIGVPFLYDHGDCYLGDEDIINYFESRL